MEKVDTYVSGYSGAYLEELSTFVEQFAPYVPTWQLDRVKELIRKGKIREASGDIRVFQESRERTPLKKFIAIRDEHGRREANAIFNKAIDEAAKVTAIRNGWIALLESHRCAPASFF